MSGRMTFFLFTLIPVVLYTFFYVVSVINGVCYSIMLVIGVIVTSLILAISLNSLKIFKTLTKSIYFVPAMIGGVTIALIWDQL